MNFYLMVFNCEIMMIIEQLIQGLMNKFVFFIEILSR